MYCAVLKLCGAVLLTGKKLESGRSHLFWLDEKTTEPQQEMPSAPKPTAQRGEKLRSLWARLQCVHLLRRHRFRRKTQHHMNNVSQKMRATPMVQTVGEGLYALAFRRNMPSSAPGGGSARQPCGWRPGLQRWPMT